MSLKVKTNFGAIGGRRIVTFKVSSDGSVQPAWFRRSRFRDYLPEVWITGHEAFRRWKVARKAWRSRKRRQLELGL